MTAIDRFLSGDTSPETLDALRYAVTRWMLDADTGPALHRVLGLGTRRAARRERRDALLREAASLLTGSTWERARDLSAAAREFEARRWRRWRYVGVPDTASRLEALLFEARQLGAIALTARHYFNVLEAVAQSGNAG